MNFQCGLRMPNYCTEIIGFGNEISEQTIHDYVFTLRTSYKEHMTRNCLSIALVTSNV
jgi:hypothetical protein